MKKLLFIILILTLCFPIVTATTPIVHYNAVWPINASTPVCVAPYNYQYMTYAQGLALEWFWPGAWVEDKLLSPNDPGFIGGYVKSMCNKDGANDYYDYEIWYKIFAPNVIFSISDSANFTKKLSGVVVQISNGQTNTTSVSGVAEIAVYPPLNNYTYSLVKSGYTSISGISLGGYGETGGVVYNTMELSPTGGGIPSGYTRTTVYAQDASIGTVIIGATLNIRDVQNNSWVNATSSSTGTIIDILNGHTLDIYGSYPGVYTASQELDAYAGGSYYLPLYPPAIPAASGFVNLVVSVYESGTGMSIQSCGVTTKVPSGAVTYESTGSTGTAYFVVPNNSVIILSATKNGWNGQSESLTTTDADVYTTFALSRATLPTVTSTPVVTGTDGHVITAVPTVDARTNAEKDAALMTQLRDAGPMLISLCIMAILFGIIKMMAK